LQADFLIGVFWGFYRTPEAQRNMPAVNARIRALRPKSPPAGICSCASPNSPTDTR